MLYIFLQVDYTIDVIIQRCRAVAPSSSNATLNGSPSVSASGLQNNATISQQAPTQQCSLDIVTVSPSRPGACVALSSLGTNAAAAAGAPCDVLVQLDGDFAAFTDTPDYTSKAAVLEPHTWGLTTNPLSMQPCT